MTEIPKKGGSGLPLHIAVVTAALYCFSCAAPIYHTILRDEAPYIISLESGLQWEYWKIGTSEAGRSPVTLDTLTVIVAESYPPPDGPVRIDPLINLSLHPAFQNHTSDSEEMEKQISRSSPLPSYNSFYLPAAPPSDSLELVEHLAVEVMGRVFRIESYGRTSGGKHPYFMANSSAGLLDFTSWIALSYMTDPKPTYRRYLRSADLIVPAPDSRIGAWNTGTSGWIVTTTDTLIAVPLGEFKCTEISYYMDSSSGELDLDSYREYWAPGMGLVAWIDFRSEGDGHWVLANYRSVKQDTSKIPAERLNSP